MLLDWTLDKNPMQPIDWPWTLRCTYNILIIYSHNIINLRIAINTEKYNK